MISFTEIEPKELVHFQGGEGSFFAKMTDDGLNRILHGRLEPGCSIGLHRHETSSEIIFILSGRGRAVIDGREELLAPGDCHYCKKGSAHTLFCFGEDEPLCFYAVVPQQ